MYILIAFITLLVALFMYTSVKTVTRQMENNMFNQAFRVDFHTSPLDILYQNKYIHSVWYIDKQHKILYTHDKINHIPDTYLKNDWVVNVDLENDSLSWGSPFVYENTTLVPYMRISKGVCTAVMFPFYL